jgi:predicted carbohydrate-binding protein with CBM5 and CBM33 domain
MSMNKTGKSGMIIALSIAMLGATTVVTYGALQVEAAAPFWCYEVTGGNKCIADPDAKRSDCVAASQADPNSVNPGKCFPENKIK